MSKENSRETKLKYIFAQYPKTKEFHVTSDDQAFTNESDARNHAKTLEDQQVEVAKRSDYVKGKEKNDVLDTDDAAERETLVNRHNELFGKLPATNAKSETIKAKIDAEEARVAAEAEKAKESGDGSNEGAGE